MGPAAVHPTRAVAYVRTSTDDKGQDPRRQLEILRSWARTHRVQVVAELVDEGASASKEEPFQRKQLVEAAREAQRQEALLLMETADRFTRLDSDYHGWAKVELVNRYGVRLVYADLGGPNDQNRLIGHVKAEAGHEWVEAHKAKVKSGMDRARAEGRTVGGRPRKELSTAEQEIVRDLWTRGESERAITAAVNASRGLSLATDPKERRRRGVSRHVVRRALKRVRGRKPDLVGNPDSPMKKRSERGEVLSDRGDGA